MSTENLAPTTTYQAIVGRILISKRELVHLDQAAMANAVGLSPSTWSRVERGESALTMDHLVRAAEALGTTPGTILAEVDNAVAALTSRGVVVEKGTTTKLAQAGLALVVGAALGILLSKVLSK